MDDTRTVMSWSTRGKVQESEIRSRNVKVVSKQYSKSSSSTAQDGQVKSKNNVEVNEAYSAVMEPAGFEHEQNVYNTELLKRSPQLANGQVKQKEEYSDALHDQSWFRVHSDVFKDKFYWNHYEKTDLTYSKLSPYYNMEISPGVPVMPNLSRRPLRSSSVAGTFTPRRDTYHSSAYSKGRSSSTSSNRNVRTTYTEQQTSGYGFDGYSDDEADFISRRRTVNISEQQTVSLVTTFYKYIVTVLTSIYSMISHTTSVLLNRRNVVYGDVYRGYSTPQVRQQSSHAGVVKWGQWLYRLLCLHLLADSWIVHHLRTWTRTTVDDDERRHVTTNHAGRRSNCSCLMFGLFFLLPLALLAGWWAVGAYPLLSSKPAELLQTLAELGNQHSNKEEIRQPVINNNNEKEYFNNMQSYITSLTAQVEALKEQLKQQHLEMETQQARLQSMEKNMEHLDVKSEQSTSKDSNIESALHHLQMSLHSVTGKVHQLSRCCNRPPIIPAAVIQGHVLHFLRNIFNSEGADDYADIHAWVKIMFVAKDELESRLANVSAAIHSNVSEELLQSAKIIMESVAEKIIQSKLDQHHTAFQVTATNSMNEIENGGLTYAQVRQIVQEALTIYDADKTGLVDYALESSGGSILSTRCTENFNTQSATLYMFNLPWLPWFSVGTSPRMAIQPHMSPGECWAFAGAQGFLVIQLSREVIVSGFTLEHIPKSLSPNGHIDSAPEKFSVWGLEHENDEDPLFLGSYTYMQNSTSLQYFKVQQEEARPFRIVELKVVSNHGHPNYTCIYRFRVHGTPVQK